MASEKPPGNSTGRLFKECLDEFLDDLVAHRLDFAERAAEDDGLGGGFEDFEAVEDFEDGLA